MSVQFNRMPEYNQPLLEKGKLDRGYFSFFSGLIKGQPTGPAAPVTAGPSPFTFKATQGGTLIIQGGTVSLVSLTRDGIANFNTGQTQGLFPVSQGDALIVNYSVLPNLTFVPR